MYCFTIDVIFFALHFLKAKPGFGHPLTDVFNVITSCLKVRWSIIYAGNNDMAFCSQIFWYKDANKFLFNWFQKLQSWSDFSPVPWFPPLYYGDVLPLCCHTVCGGDQADKVAMWLPTDLALGNDDLAGVGITGVLDGEAEDADNSDQLARFFHPVFYIAGITNEVLTASNLSFRFHTNHFSILQNDFFSGLLSM